MDLKRAHLMRASERDLANAMHIFSPPRKEERSTIRSVVASIVFDSFMQPALAGIRGPVVQRARQVVMRVEDFDIHIKIWGDPGFKQMLGQLMPRNGKEFVEAARFHLVRNGERLRSTTNEETGEFHFMDVPEGDLSLQVDLPSLTVIGALNIQGRL
jgi:hypothetical protein